jgi:hypothetical protein
MNNVYETNLLIFARNSTEKFGRSICISSQQQAALAIARKLRHPARTSE